ncbi:MAG TPA: TetR/AcrR family transcriptional regulator [Dongiaceae bacterium]|nr:TetR/AcrR family transcriptional regulator [Dongiaceae bacterium]
MKSRSTPQKTAKTPAAAKDKKPAEKPATEKRRYNSVVRQQQSTETREHIITSGVQLAHEFPAWDWKNLTFRAVGERAGISERTVYRYFATEQALKDAVMQRLVKESGINLNALTLPEFTATIKSLFQYMLSFSAKSKELEDPSFSSVDQDRRTALLRSVVEATPGWSEAQQLAVTASLDIFWQPSTYERLQNAWNFDFEQSIATLTWLIDLVETAIKDKRLPDIG